jgi:DMSO/TMAO reductase YedYZ heme-binding membrane subunit
MCSWISSSTGSESSAISSSGRSLALVSWHSVALVPLALTSTRASVRKLGFRRWQRLHQLAYLAGVLAVTHFIWRVKIDVSQPITYAFALALLLAVRSAFWLAARKHTP